MTFKIGDLVTIIAQPQAHEPNSHINMKGISGFIEGINGKYAQFSELRKDGCGGFGAVPLDCLKLENDNDLLLSLKKKRDDRIANALQISLDYTAKYNAFRNAAIQKVVEITGVSMRDAIKIFEMHEEWKSEWDRNNY